MKKLLTITLAMLMAGLVLGQAPNLVNYQGVARDLAGDPLVNQSISLRISILSGSPTGASSFTETHSVITNSLGLFTISIGNGTTQSGSFSAIDWGNAAHYIRTELDEAGGSNYTLMGTTQILSVPYALYAERAGSGQGSQWQNNSDGIYYNNGTVVIGDTIDRTWLGLASKPLAIVNSDHSEFAFGGGNGGPQYIGFSDAGQNVSFSIKRDTRINGQPTLSFSTDAQQGTARHYNFRSDGNNKLTIMGTGNVGVGTNTTIPAAKLHIQNGDVYIDDIGSGVIMKSPNGNCWRVTISNTGSLIRTAISCP